MPIRSLSFSCKQLSFPQGWVWWHLSYNLLLTFPSSHSLSKSYKDRNAAFIRISQETPNPETVALHHKVLPSASQVSKWPR